MKITAEMLPQESGDVIKAFYAAAFPEGQTVEELKNSDHLLFREIAKHFEKEAEGNGA